MQLPVPLTWKVSKHKAGIRVIGAGSIVPALVATAVAAMNPAAEFDSLEQRLSSAAAVRVNFDITAEGVIVADLRGSLSISGDQIQLTASGTFAGESVELTLRSDGEQLELAAGVDRVSTATPAHLKESLLIGFTRMGILHNLARLTETAVPDHADGGARDWVTVGSFGSGDADGVEISFDLAVAGEPAGSAILAVDSQGRPTLRRQTVEFPSGQMRVVERYSELMIDR